MVPSTAPEDIAAYAQRVGDAWKIGRRDVGDGLLIVVAKDDRRVNIETAKALEGAMPDLAARQIIDRAIVPAFRAGDYAGGLDAAVDQLMARIQGEALPRPPAARRRARRSRRLQVEELLIFFFVGVPVIGAVLTGLLGRKLGSLVTAGVGRRRRLVAHRQRAAGRAGAVAGRAGAGGPVRHRQRGARHRARRPARRAADRSGAAAATMAAGAGRWLRRRRRFSSGGGGDFGGGGASGSW